MYNRNGTSYYRVKTGKCKKKKCRSKAKWCIGKDLWCQKHANRWFKKNPGPPKENKYLTVKDKRRTCTKRIMALRKKATPAELCFKKKLSKFDIKFKFQRGFIKGNGYAIVDFYIPRYKLCIEIDGGYHNTPAQRSKDKWRDNWLRTMRHVEVVRFTNEQAFDISNEELGLFLDECDRNHQIRLKATLLTRKSEQAEALMVRLTAAECRAYRRRMRDLKEQARVEKALLS